LWGSPPLGKVRGDPATVSQPSGHANEIEVSEEGEKMAPAHGNDVPEVGRAQVSRSAQTFHHRDTGSSNYARFIEELTIHIDHLPIPFHKTEDPFGFPYVPEGLPEFP